MTICGPSRDGFRRGVNHERLTFRFQGRDFRLTDVAGEVVQPPLA